jgi:Uma2 family endonuclease
MSTIAKTKLPDHKDLPCDDGAMVHNFQELPLSMLLTDTILPRLRQLFPSGWFTIGQDCAIYWRITDPPLDGSKAPDWFVVLNVPPTLDGGFRRSYVLWQEEVRPLILLEFVSNDRGEEHDRTPETGKFWVYEQQVRAPYYGIFDAEHDTLEFYRLLDGQYQLQAPNEHGRYPLPPLGVELGIWHAPWFNVDTAWLRWWDADGTMLPTEAERAAALERQAAEDRRRADTERLRAEDEQRRADEEKLRAQDEQRRAAEERRLSEEARQRADQEKQRADQEKQRAEAERQQIEKLKEKLRSLGIDPDTL